MGVQKIRTSPHHPQTNGQVERAHQTLRRMIGKLEGANKENWTDHLSELTFAYNSTRSAITGYSPYYLMFGRRPRFPVDFHFPTKVHIKDYEVDSYVAQLRSRLKQYFQYATQACLQEAERQKRLYDRRSHAAELKPGDQVLARVLGYVGKRKINDKWESEPYIVQGRLHPGSAAPIYLLHDKDGKPRKLHRNHLLLINPVGTTVSARTNLDPPRESLSEEKESPLQSESTLEPPQEVVVTEEDFQWREGKRLYVPGGLDFPIFVRAMTLGAFWEPPNAGKE